MAKQKKDNSKNLLVYILILIIIVLLAFILLRYSFTHYSSFRGHQDYFKNNTSPKIESWMTPSTVLRHFNISESSLFNELNITKTTANLRTPIANLCTNQKQDCSLVINNLNSMVK